MTRFDSIRKRHQALAQKLFPETIARVNWSKRDLLNYRNRALQELLRICKTSSRWHKDRLSNINSENATESDLSKIPTMTKNDLMVNFDEIITNPALTLARCEEHIASGETYLDEEYCVFASGGSSGVRAVSIFGFEEAALNYVLGRRFMVRWAHKSGAFKGNPTSASVGAAPGSHGTYHLSKIFSSGDENTFSVTDPLADIIKGLNSVQPDILVVYASYLPHLIAAVEQDDLKIEPKLVIASAEPLLEEHDEMIRCLWRCPVFSSWGATETGLMGASSGFGPGLMLYDDHVIVEPVDRNGNAVPPGVRADKLFITPLFHHVLPVLRYEISDQLTVLDEPNSCGSNFTRTSLVEGRLDDWFMYKDGITIHPHVFRTELSNDRNIMEYQVIQTSHGAHIKVVLNRSGNLASMAERVTDALERFGLQKPVVKVEEVPSLQRIGSATKVKRFVAQPE